MIINKMSFERGFAAASIYKSTFVDLKEIATGRKDSRVSSNIRDSVPFFQIDIDWWKVVEHFIPFIPFDLWTKTGPCVS